MVVFVIDTLLGGIGVLYAKRQFSYGPAGDGERGADMGLYRRGNEEILLFFAEGLARVDFFLYLCGGFEIKVFNLYIYYGYTCKNAGARAAKPKAHCVAGGR